VAIPKPITKPLSMEQRARIGKTESVYVPIRRELPLSDIPAKYNKWEYIYTKWIRFYQSKLRLDRLTTEKKQYFEGELLYWQLKLARLKT
jgi:hypothetical protein